MPVNGQPPYDDQNVFARILRNEIPSRRVYEDEWAVAFHDISPQAPVHILVVPRGRFVSLTDFAEQHRLARLSIDDGIGPETRFEPQPVTITLSGKPVVFPSGAFK